MSSQAKRPRARDTQVPAHADLPEYTLRLSDRAKRVRLVVTPRDGLVVIVPRRMRGFDPSEALRERRDWIQSAHVHFAERRAALLADADALLPGTVTFAATGEAWPVEYRSTAAATVSARILGGLLVVQGAVENADACLAALRRWLQRAARERLLPLLAEESAVTGLAYLHASVRAQRNRWGGCSTTGAVTLNRCLVFLPPRLARAVILHELAHLRFPNHSREYWRYLETLDPEVSAHRHAIREAWNAVPPWAEP